MTYLKARQRIAFVVLHGISEPRSPRGGYRAISHIDRVLLPRGRGVGAMYAGQPHQKFNSEASAGRSRHMNEQVSSLPVIVLVTTNPVPGDRTANPMSL